MSQTVQVQTFGDSSRRHRIRRVLFIKKSATRCFRARSSGSLLERVSENITDIVVDDPLGLRVPQDEHSNVLLKRVHFLLILLWNMFLTRLWIQRWMFPYAVTVVDLPVPHVSQFRRVPSKWNKLVPYER